MKAILVVLTSLFFLICLGQAKDAPDWEMLLLETGYIESLSDVTEYQLSFLDEVKSNYNTIETEAYLEAQKMLNVFYEDHNPIEEIFLSGLTIPENKTAKVWELYFESLGVDENGNEKSLMPIIMFKGTKIIGTTSVH